jgi:hypothetical protein
MYDTRFKYCKQLYPNFNAIIVKIQLKIIDVHDLNFITLIVIPV